MTDYDAKGGTRRSDGDVVRPGLGPVEPLAGLVAATVAFAANVALGAAWIEQDPGYRPLGSLVGTVLVFVLCVAAAVTRPRIGMGLGLGLGALWVIGLSLWEQTYSGGTPWEFGLRGFLAYGAHLPATAAATATLVTASLLTYHRHTKVREANPPGVAS